MLIVMYARLKAPSFLEAPLRERRTALLLIVAGALLLGLALMCPDAASEIDGLFLSP